MAAVIKTIEDLANNLAPLYSNVHIVPRGTPRFVDPQLKGTLAWSRRIGNTLPVIQPQNEIALTQDALILQNQIKVNRLLPGFSPDSLIQINKQEVLKIQDVDSQLLTILLTEDLLVPHTTGSSVDLFGVPIRVSGPVTPGGVLPAHTTTKIYCRSPYQMVTGDQLYIQQDVDLLLSGADYTITECVPLGTVANDRLYGVTLDHPIPRDLALNDLVYLRTFPSYVSPLVRIPRHRRRPQYLGPFLVDYVSGRFDDGEDIEETLDLQVFEATGAPHLGTRPPETTGNYFVRSRKNFPVLSVPIHASSFLFWDILQGKINYQPDQFILQADATGVAAISVELQPGWEGQQTWISQAQGLTADSGAVYCRFYPNDSKFAGAITSAAPSTLEFSLEGVTSTRLEVVFVGPPNSMMKWTSWSPVRKSTTLPTQYTQAAVETLQYTLSSRVTGNNIWQAGSLMIKPYFHVAADIQGVNDFDSFDNGSVML